MRIDVITGFPAIMREPLNESILKQAQQRVDLQIRIWDLRDFASDRHRTIDDQPYGGGPGMVLKPEPIFKALEEILSRPADKERARIIYPTPQGKRFDQKMAEELAREAHLVFICGHYKAVDQRVIDTWVTDEISVGDFVLSGGEIPTLLIIDAVVRLIPGVLGDPDSARTDSFSDNLLDSPYYTRPEDFRGLKVPEVLLSGNHQQIARWRLEQRIQRTRERRPDLYQKYARSEPKKSKRK